MEVKYQASVLKSSQIVWWSNPTGKNVLLIRWVFKVRVLESHYVAQVSNCDLLPLPLCLAAHFYLLFH